MEKRKKEKKHKKLPWRGRATERGGAPGWAPCVDPRWMGLREEAGHEGEAATWRRAAAGGRAPVRGGHSRGGWQREEEGCRGEEVGLRRKEDGCRGEEGCSKS
jgi:hypothetical protein